MMVTTSIGSHAEARAIGHALVQARVAACVQIMPIESVYRWEGAVVEAQEHLVICKIRAADYTVVATTIRENHAYDVPEIVGVPIVAGSQPYLAWIESSTTR